MSATAYTDNGTSTRQETTSGLRVWPLNRAALLTLTVGGLIMFVVWSTAGLLFMHFLDDGPVGDADRRVVEWFEDQRTPTINSMSYWGSMLSDTFVKVGLIIVVGGAMVFVWRRWHDALYLALAVITEATVFLFTSLVVDRERPPVEQLDTIPPSGSFPSGHVAAAVAFYGSLFVVVCWHTRRRGVRAVFLAIAVIVPVVVATSRMARGMHHPIDVTAGALLGLATVLLVRIALRNGVRRIGRQVADGERTAPEHTLHLDLNEPLDHTEHGVAEERLTTGGVR